MNEAADKKNDKPAIKEKNESTNMSAFNESTNLQSNDSTVSDCSDSMAQQIDDSSIRPIDFSTGSDVVIRVDNIWKEYRLGTINHGTLSSDLQSWWARMRGKTDPNQKIDSTIQQINDLTSSPDRFWALRDVSFDVKQGEVLGILGKNGAGKSTLLKILSQVTTPTKGQINIKGRVASLLEVGTGFHPELTGRENVFLNGAILGMSKHEIRSKFDEIVAFAEIDKFIDTPVKRYSSGMYVRLAFAVAAHLEPEILVVDEVLAVGDVQFQKKCLGKMEDVGREGRTVLFVSHNMSAIQRLCSKAVSLDRGELIATGRVSDVVSQYLKDSDSSNSRVLDYRKMCEKGYRSHGVRFSDCKIVDSKGDLTSKLKYTEPFSVCLKMEASRNIENLAIHIGIDSPSGARIFTSDSEEFGSIFELSENGETTIMVHYKDFSLMPGRYYISKLMVRQGRNELISLQSGPYFEVTPQEYGENIPPFVNTGLVSGKSKWVEG